MKVLVATDGSKYGKWELNWVARLPFVEPPRVTVMHVLDFAALRAPFLPQPVAAGIEHYVQKEIRRMEARSAKALKEAKQQLVALKLKGTVRKEQGAIAPTILKHAPKQDGLVLVGSKGLDALDRFMLGSVSTQVTIHAPCTVLAVKERARPLRRILLATDGSKFAEKALHFLTTKLRAKGWKSTGGSPPEVTIVHVMAFLKGPELKNTERKLVQRYGAKLQNAGYAVDEICRLGNPADEILDIASEKHVDLIVTGAKGLGAIARFFLGSVSTRIVQHSSCSVLVVR